jgi:hypothetical protein
VNYELKRMWKKRSWRNFEVLSQDLPGGTEENHENCRDSRDLNPGPPEYESGVLTTGPRRSVLPSSNFCFVMVL